MVNYQLHTDRLYFDRLTVKHVPALVAAINSPVLRFTYFLNQGVDGMDKFSDTRIFTEKDMEEIVGLLSKAPKIQSYGIFLKDTTEMIGHCDYNYGWDTHAIFSNLIIYPLHQRNGFGTEAAGFLLDLIFNETVAHNVSTGIDGDNQVGKVFLEKMGFTACGTIRRVSFAGGKYRSYHEYDILRPEWRQRHAN